MRSLHRVGPCVNESRDHDTFLWDVEGNASHSRAPVLCWPFWMRFVFKGWLLALRLPATMPGAIHRRTAEEVQQTDRLVRRWWSNSGKHVDLSKLNAKLRQKHLPEFSGRQWGNYKARLKARRGGGCRRRRGGVQVLQGISKDKPVPAAVKGLVSYILMRHCFEGDPSKVRFKFVSGSSSTLTKAWFLKFVGLKGPSLCLGNLVSAARKEGWMQKYKGHLGKAVRMGSLRVVSQLHPVLPLERPWLATVADELLGVTIYMQARLRCCSLGSWWAEHMAASENCFSKEEFRRTFAAPRPFFVLFLFQSWLVLLQGVPRVVGFSGVSSS